MTEEERILEIIGMQEWTFAKTSADAFPHEYVTADRCRRAGDFGAICAYILKDSHYEWFFGRRGLYRSIGEHTYWIRGRVVNRRWNDMYELDGERRIRRVAEWRELLGDGRILHG